MGPMQTAFLKCMRLLFGARGSVGLTQLRDLIRVFCMGWSECAVHRADPDALEEWIEETKPTADPNWWPDDSWKWWRQ